MSIESSLQRKYAELSAKSRPRRSMVWLTNDAENLRNPDNPVLIEVSAEAWTGKSKAYQKQGYRKFESAAKAPDPVEAAVLEPQQSDGTLSKRTGRPPKTTES